ncbi:outer membrane protein assembly factor BamE [Noviherbaspirillum sp.]|uniref:outer membrane protein assembly factor BamE n=1 Tax=Noviherbaspirillum sp. TaxID=1926288 RepID=UPI002B46D4F1|nr:outer membrane protein assembly factor BamE [Noviherbaspirillum sp.]HJV81239.1 outer membrane protein assembly factor BamE [Noviherbaspirillum sp.]
MEEPAPSAAASATKPAEPVAQNAASAPAATPVPGASGVTTTKPTGVQRFLGIFTPYRIDVQQGNFVSREMVNQLKEGMQRKEAITPEQVRFVLGTPLLTDIFHANRWDYVFRLKKGSGEVISSRVTAYFKDNRLVGIDSGVLPTEQEYLAFIAGAAPGSAPNK